MAEGHVVVLPMKYSLKMTTSTASIAAIACLIYH